MYKGALDNAFSLNGSIIKRPFIEYDEEELQKLFTLGPDGICETAQSVGNSANERWRNCCKEIPEEDLGVLGITCRSDASRCETTTMKVGVAGGQSNGEHSTAPQGTTEQCKRNLSIDDCNSDPDRSKRPRTRPQEASETETPSPIKQQSEPARTTTWLTSSSHREDCQESATEETDAASTSMQRMQTVVKSKAAEMTGLGQGVDPELDTGKVAKWTMKVLEHAIQKKCDDPTDFGVMLKTINVAGSGDLSDSDPAPPR